MGDVFAFNLSDLLARKLLHLSEGREERKKGESQFQCKLHLKSGDEFVIQSQSDLKIKICLCSVQF